MIKMTKVRAGLYETVIAGDLHRVEEFHDGRRWVWRVVNSDALDGWIADTRTLAEAKAVLAEVAQEATRSKCDLIGHDWHAYGACGKG